MTIDILNIAGALVAAGTSVIAILIKRMGELPRRVVTANSAEPASRNPLQPAVDRLDEARLALEHQNAVAKTNRWTSGLLTFGQYIIGGLLASSFVQQSLSREFVGVLGLLVLVSSLVYQHFRPDIQLRGSLGRAFRLRALIRQGEDDLYAMQSQSPDAPTIENFRRTISTALSEIESSELQDIAIREHGQTKELKRSGRKA